jgi:hypothetical protein
MVASLGWLIAAMENGGRRYIRALPPLSSVWPGSQDRDQNTPLSLEWTATRQHMTTGSTPSHR